MSDVDNNPGIAFPQKADIYGSELLGGIGGALVRRNSELNLYGSSVTATSALSNGINLNTGTVRLYGSRVTGQVAGISIINGDTPDYPSYGRHLTVDGSHLAGINGAAISVSGTPALPTDVDIAIANGSTLIGGNGNILEVDQFSTVDFTVDNSALEGNIAVEGGGAADITLQNNASLEGQITGVENLALNSGGSWKMIADGGVTNLFMAGGGVEISDGSGSSFNTLTVDTLSGNGTFDMATDIAGGVGDKLVVTETDGAQGDHVLRVKNSGVDPTSDNELTIVDTNGGNASFSLLGRAVDLGVYKYRLYKVGDDWKLIGPDTPPICTPGVDCPVDPDPGPGPGPGPGPDPVDPPRDLSESAKTVIGLHAASANVWYGETGTLRSRMDDVRMGKGENGIWGRTYGRDFNGNGAAGVEFDQSLWGLQVGAETEVNLGGLPVILGVFGGYSNSAVKFDAGSRGDIDSGYGGIYATWLGNDGLYVDGLFKVNRFSNDARVVMSDGSPARGDYSATGIGGQIEVGKTYDLGNGWYAEPFAQLAALRVGSFDYGLDNGMTAHGDAYGSVQGRIGATIGINHKLENGGVFQPYVRFAVAQEFVDSNKLRINTVEFNNAFDGTRGEVGAGFAYQISDKLQVHADIDFSAGKDIDSNWGGNLGLSYRF
ncbi:hypothetical protein LCM4573_10530 [Rhizobium sp. LCM 4573]|nr:hypothetical protein LCM4573_10530 [Rhizobium sp. LCM 4573]